VEGDFFGVTEPEALKRYKAQLTGQGAEAAPAVKQESQAEQANALA